MNAFSRKWLVLALSSLCFSPLLSAAEVADPAVDEPAAAADSSAVVSASAQATGGDTGLTSDILFQYLLAEVAAGRGKFALSVSQYGELAKRTQDPRIARRATEVALYAQNNEAALENARLWYQLEADSIQARHTYWLLLVTQGQQDELMPSVKQAMKTLPEQERVELIQQLPRFFLGVSDKRLVQQQITELTADYLSLPESRLVRAQAAVAAKDEPTALIEIDQALQLRPDWQLPALFRAQLLAPQPPRAIASLQHFLARNPDAREANIALARLFIETRRFPEAKASFGRVLKNEPNNPDLIYAVALLDLQMNQPQAAEPGLRRLLELPFRDQDSVRLYLGQCAELRGDMAAAVAYYDQVVGDPGRVSQARLRAAEALRRAGRIDESLERLKAANAAEPIDRDKLRMAEVQLLTDAKRFEEALTLLKEGLKAQPDQPEFLYEAAMLAERLNRWPEAEAWLLQLIKLQPDHPQALNALGYTLADRGERLEEATQYINRALALAPDDFYILDSKGWLLYRQGQLAEAERWLRKAFAQKADAEIAAHLGEVLWMLGQQGEARQLWQAALKADPDNEALQAVIKRFIP